jgi:integrase
MARRSRRIPSYRLHKPSGKAVVTINGHDHYLGPHDSPESKQKYAKLIQEWTANQDRPAAEGTVAEAPADLTINELVLAFWDHAKAYYVKADGSPTGEQQAIKYSLRPLAQLYGDEPACEFGPRKLKVVRQAMIDSGLARSLINKRINRIRHLFKWGVENEMVSPLILQALKAVAPLKRGRTKARETEPVKPAPQEHIDVIQPHVSPQVWAMVQLQLRTAMRPGEVVIMRKCDIDRSGKVWVYVPKEHKTAHHGHDRKVYLGPQAQQILRPFLLRPDDAYLFSPAEAEKLRYDKLEAESANRGRRRNLKVRRKTKRHVGDHYDRDAYRRAITRGLEHAFPPPGDLAKSDDETWKQYNARLTEEDREAIRQWRGKMYWHPHQLRHNAATFLRQEFGVEAARLILGHRSIAVTELYAELNHDKALQIIEAVG